MTTRSEARGTRMPVSHGRVKGATASSTSLPSERSGSVMFASGSSASGSASGGSWWAWACYSLWLRPLWSSLTCFARWSTPNRRQWIVAAAIALLILSVRLSGISAGE